MPLECSLKNMGINHSPQGFYNQQLGPVAQRYILALETLLLQLSWLRPQRKIVTGSPLTIFVSHAEALLDFHHNQHLSISYLISCEIFLLNSSYITLSCNNLNSAISETDDASHNCLALISHLMTPSKDSQQTSLSKAYFLRFIGGSYKNVKW